MAIKKIDGALFKTLVLNGAANLKKNYQYIDSLNVFPVPDGDTGTNMKMTIEGGVSEIATFDEKSIYEMSKKLARGMLMGARGNSGVILSQLFRGFNKGCEECVSLNAITLAKAFASGVTQAYKAVMKPVEGTILTVAREASEKMSLIANSKMTVEEFFDEYIAEAKNSLQRTPDLLPQLKEANVVDSGGAGYICIIEGMRMALDGNMITDDSPLQVMDTHIAQFSVNEDTKNDEFGYCTEFVMQLLPDVEGKKPFEQDVLKEFLLNIGVSVVLVSDGEHVL